MTGMREDTRDDDREGTCEGTRQDDCEELGFIELS